MRNLLRAVSLRSALSEFWLALSQSKNFMHEFSGHFIFELP